MAKACLDRLGRFDHEQVTSLVDQPLVDLGEHAHAAGADEVNGGQIHCHRAVGSGARVVQHRAELARF